MAHIGLMKEIKAYRIESIDLDHDVELLKKTGGSARDREKRYRRTTEGQWSRRRSQIQSWKTTRSSTRSSTRSRLSHGSSIYNSKRDSTRREEDKKAHTLESGSPRRGRRKSEGDVLDAEPLRPDLGHEILHQGMLHKTTRAKTARITRTQSEHRQYRRFQLTEHALEYTQLLQKVKVRKQFPLTSIADIVYSEGENPHVFKLVFQKNEMLLEDVDKGQCKLWVIAITKEWEKWNGPLLRKKSTQKKSRAELEESTTVLGDAVIRGGYLEEDEGYFRTGDDVKAATSPMPKDFIIPKEHIPSVLEDKAEHTQASVKYIRRETDLPSPDIKQAAPARVALQGIIGLAPRLQRTQWDAFQQKLRDGGDGYAALHNTDFPMIKYPRKGQSIPHERVFTMDFENLLVMWRRTAYSKFSRARSLLTEHILEVREGQNSDGFDRYPYEEVNSQSFSVIVEGEKQAVGRKYAALQSLDLVCDSCEEKKLWCGALRSFISPKRHLFSSRYEYTDPTVLWLKSNWIVLSEGGSEIREDAAFSFGQNLVPQMPGDILRSHLDTAHAFQLKEAVYHGSSLHWDGFILFFNLLCGIDENDCLVLEEFQEYAKDYPQLGMTVEEFRAFLIDRQDWLPDEATHEKCEKIMRRYDYHHRAFKMYLAKGKPFEFHICTRLFSFGGFLSFLRSADNAVIDKEKDEDVNQDMSQPLSHYFINSSHNTYLEGHQLTGRSTTDAYVRALLQGCRCLELDCWDGPNGEPKITHGNTLVSELSLLEVVKVIDEYAFQTSIYPLILSLENHCSNNQQIRMAEIFQEVFGNKLVKENLVELYDLDRLPSPHDLQGKIILKGTEKNKRKKTLKSPPPRRQSDLAIEQSIEAQPRRSSELAGSVDNVWEYPTQCNSSQGDINRRVEEEEERPEYEQEDLYEDLNKLIIYCRSKHIRPWSWGEQQKTSVCNMFSFGESSAFSKCEKHPKELLACTERQLVRTYPAGLRTDSSNYDPIPMWNNGIHMVALNIQTPSLPVYLNQGKFRQNGGCGYILKPAVMREPNEKEYSPVMSGPHHAVPPVNLEITLLSGQHLMIPCKKTVAMEIHYDTYGIPSDCEKKHYICSSYDTNPVWPQFGHTPRLEKTILMPELCLVLFAVYIRVRRKLLTGTKTVLLGQNVFPLTSLKPGLRFIPLRTPGGESSSHIGLFVKIGLKALRHKEASCSGKCQDDYQPSMQKFGLSNLPETCHLSDSVEDMISVDEPEPLQFNVQVTPSSIGTANGHVRPQVFARQGAITVEVHANANDEPSNERTEATFV